jgi:hypothetical protein
MPEKNFKFWVPLDDIVKGKDDKGNEVMKVGGIASTNAEDADGEFLDPNGFDVSYFLKSGFLNYHHQAKNDPNAIIGEPTVARITKEGLYIEGFLYPDNPIAQAVYNTATSLKKNSSTRNLGFSIEGKAIDRDLVNPKIIKKAMITGCAITFMPKNPKTYMDLIKGGCDDDYSDEYDDETELLMKDLSAGVTTGTETTDVAIPGQGDALKLESFKKPSKKKPKMKNDFQTANGKEVILDKGEVEEEEEENEEEEGEDEEIDLDLLDEDKMSKASCYEEIFTKKTAITLLEAEKLYNFIEKCAMQKGENITKKTISEAIDLLDKALDSDVIESNDDSIVKSFNSEKLRLAELEKELIEKGLIVKEEVETKEDPLLKAISDISTLVTEKNHHIGVILKNMYKDLSSLSEKIDAIQSADSELKKSLDSTELSFNGLRDTISDLSKSFDSQPITRKSIPQSTVRERNFGGQVPNNDIQKGGDSNVISLTNRRLVLDILDKATFHKGEVDLEFSEALTSFETGGKISQSVLQRLRMEKGITLQ